MRGEEKEMKKLIIILIIVSILASLISYPYLPDSMPSHWNINNEVDAYSSKLLPAIMFPSLLVFFYLLAIYLPKLDPLEKNINKFKKEFHTFILIIIIFFTAIQAFVILTGLGYALNISYIMIPALSVLFYYVSILLEKSKRNWFIGIRTPWTLSSDKVWEKTHKIGARLFKLISIVNLLGIWFTSKAIIVTVSLALFSVVYLTIYSYLEYIKKK